MSIQIKDDSLILKINSNVNLIKRTVAGKNISPENYSKSKRGSIYVDRDHIGKLCIFFLREPSETHSEKKGFKYNGEIFEYYDMTITDIKSAKTGKTYTTGRIYFPGDWIDKEVAGLILKE